MSELDFFVVTSVSSALFSKLFQLFAGGSEESSEVAGFEELSFESLDAENIT